MSDECDYRQIVAVFIPESIVRRRLRQVDRVVFVPDTTLTPANVALNAAVRILGLWHGAAALGASERYVAVGSHSDQLMLVERG